MSVEQAVVEKLGSLPPPAQRQVLDFVEFLASRRARRKDRRRLKGSCSDLNVELAEDDFASARRDLWAGFPREDPR